MFSYESRNQAIIRLYSQGNSPTSIRKTTKIRIPTIKLVIEHFQETGEILTPIKRGRISKLTSIVLSQIEAITILERTASSKKIQKIISEGDGPFISASTIWRGRKQLRFNCRPPKVRQFLNANQKISRMIFANSLLFSDFDFTKIIFSDESRFCLGSDKRWRWIRRGERDDQVFEERNKFNKGIMIFAAIGLNYKSKLVFIEGSENSLKYRHILEISNIFDEMNSKYQSGEWVFMQDGATSHTSKNSIH